MQTYYWRLSETGDNGPIIARAAAFIRQGQVVAFPTETVYGLGADGLDEAAVERIYAAKGRPSDNPLILHIACRQDLEPLSRGLNANARELARRFWPGPLTLVVPKSALVPDRVSAGLPTVAVRYPANSYAQALIQASGRPIAAPSANISGRPSPTTGRDVLEDMAGKIACVLEGGPCGIGLESTVVDTTSPVPCILRPGGITYEMLEEALGAVELDPALRGQEALRPKAPGMKYRHYAPQAPLYLLEGEAVNCLPQLAAQALQAGLQVGVLADEGLIAQTGSALGSRPGLVLCSWGRDKAGLAAGLFSLLRNFDRRGAEVILAAGVDEAGLGLAIMNRLRKAAGYNSLRLEAGRLVLPEGKIRPRWLV